LEFLPGDEERVAFGNHFRVAGGVFVETLRLAQDEDRLGRQMVEQRGKSCSAFRVPGSGSAGGASVLASRQPGVWASRLVSSLAPPGQLGTVLNESFEDAQLTARRNRHRFDVLARHLANRIESSHRLDFVAEKFEAHRPGNSEGEDIHDAAAQGDFAAMIHLHFRLIALLLEPLDQVQRIDAVAAPQRARALADVLRPKRALKKGGNAGDDERGGGWVSGSAFRVPCCVLREGDECLEPFADGVGVGELGFVRQRVPRRVEVELRVEC
jgi:hypothetical protein